MIDRDHELPLTGRLSCWAQPRQSILSTPPVPAADLAIMRRIDELHLDYPFAGSRMLRDLLRGEGIAIGGSGLRDDAADGHRGDLPPAAYVKPQTDTRFFLICCAAGGRAGEPGVGHGHHLHSDGSRLCLPGCGGGLVQPAGARLAGVDHAGGRVLPRRARRRRLPGTASRRSSIPTVRMTASAGSDDPSRQSDEWPEHRRHSRVPSVALTRTPIDRALRLSLDLSGG